MGTHLAAPALLVLVAQAASLTTVALTGGSTPAAAQLAQASVAQQPRFRHLGVDDGLPSSLISSVAQDRRGFLGVGTSRGVARYDGHRFRTYDHRPGDSTTLPAD